MRHTDEEAGARAREDERMTPEEIREIRGRADNAAPGPWEVGEDTCAQCRITGGCEFVIYEVSQGAHAPFSNKADADFIASARTDVPALCDEVERLRRALDAARAEAEALRKALGYGEEDTDEGFQVLWYLRQARVLYDGNRNGPEMDAYHEARITELYTALRAALAKSEEA